MKTIKSPTIYEIARQAGVSIATVSRAMNRSARAKVARDTLRRVDEVVKRLGYAPNLAARHLGGASFRTVGVLLPHFSGIFFSDYYAQVLAGAADATLEAGYQFKLVMPSTAGGPVWDRYNFRAAEGVDALVVTHWPNFFAKARALERLGIPCLVVNDPEPGVKARFVTGDNRMGGQLVARHLASLGHRRFAVITGPAWSSDSRERLEGFRSFFRGRHVRIETAEGGFQEERAAQAVRSLFTRDRRTMPTALFCLNDLMACGALRQLRVLGLDCPKDVSVAGYDDDRRAETAGPPLTTVRVPLYAMTRDGVRALLAGDRVRASIEKYPVELVERASAGPAGR